MTTSQLQKALSDLLLLWKPEGFIEKETLDGVNYFEKLPTCLPFDATKTDKRCFGSVQYFVENEVLIPWRDSQDEFIVFTCHKGDCHNAINWLSIFSALAFKLRETACLEEIESAAVHWYRHHTNTGFLMNNLGVMFSEIASYEKSLRCFTIAKECFELEKDDLMSAVATVNLVALHKVLGEYKKAHSFCVFAADLCQDISMRETEDVQILEKLLGSVAYLLEKLGDYKKLYCILKVGALFDIGGACKTSEVNLTKWLMKIQLEEQNGEKIKAKELGNLNSYLLALMDEPVGAILNAEFVRAVMIALEINRETGHLEEAYKLVGKLEATFWESDYPCNGSTLLQIGHFKVGVGKFSEAESTLKRAEKVLIHCFGNSHHTVGVCKSLMGTCAMLTNNTKDALKHLNEALFLFEKLNGYHPEIAEIRLKLALLYVDEGNFQSAKNATKEAMDIFISSCGEISRKTALGYFQVGMILQKVDEFKALAVDNLKKGIEIFCNLGLRPNHPDIMLYQSLLGVLQQSLGKSKEAEQCFDDVQKQAPLMEESCSTKAKLISSEVYALFGQVKADHGMGRCLSLTAQIISLVNLVHIKTNGDRHKYLNSLVSCLEENHTEFPEVWNFGGNNVHYVCQKTFITGKIVYFVVSMDQKQNSTDFEDDNRDSNMMMLSCKKSSPCLLFWRSSCSIQEMKEFKHLELALRESVTTLFLQPKFRKVYDEGKDFYIELTMPTELGENSSLCMQIDLIPLLTELKVAESDKETLGFECLTSLSSSSLAEPSVHVSYFSYKFSNKRVTEFAFDHLIASLGEDLVLQKLQVVEISGAPTLKNIAFSPFQELSPSSLSIVVDSELPVLTVKCRTLKESGSNCICFSVQNSLENAMKALHEVVQVDFETSVKMFCDGVRVDSYKQSASSNSGLDVTPEMSYPSTASETVDLVTCASTRNLESGLERKQSVETFHNWVPEELPPVSCRRDKLHADVNVCLCLLDCLLGNRNVIPDVPEEGVLDSNALSSSPYPSCDSSIHPDCSESLLSASSASSLNSQPVSPCTNYECAPFLPNKLSSDSLSSVGTRIENNRLNYALPLADQREKEEVTCSKQLLEHSSKQSTEHSGLHEEFPEKLLPSSEGLSLSSCEEGLTTGEGNPDSEAKGTDFLADLHHIQPASSNKEPPSNFYHKGDTHVESEVVHCRELQSVQCHTVQVNPKQTAAWESVTQLSSSWSLVSDSSGAGIPLNECGGLTLLRDNELAALHNQIHELQEQSNQLEEQLKKSEAEKQQLQAELGSYLFLEDKGRRNQKLQLLSRESGSEQSRQCAGSVYSALMSMNGRLLGGAGPLQEPSSTLQASLLEISDSLSADELKRMKFLVRGKVNGFRLAKIREGFELFEELETGGKYPCAYIGQLLKRVQRCDLLEKLGLPFLDDAKSGSEHLTEPQTSLPSTDVLLGRREKEPLASNRTSHVSAHSEGDDGVSRPEQRDCEYNLYASVSSAGSSDVTDYEKSVGHVTSSNDRLSLQNALNAGEQCPDSSDASLVSNSSCSSTVNSSDSLARSSQTTLSNCTSQGSPYSSSSLTSSNSLSATATSEMFSESGLNLTNSDEEIVRKSHHADNVSENGGLDEVGASAAKNEEREEEPVDLCDGVVRANKTDTRTCALGAEKTTSDGFVLDQASGTASFGPDQSAIERHSVGLASASSTDWERLGARPKRVQMQCPPPDPAPKEIVSPAVSDGLTGDFLARHSQDKALHESLYRDDADISLFNDTPLQGASCIDGMINSSESNKAKPYLGACQYTSGTDPYSPSLHGPSNGFARIGLLGGNSGVATAPLPRHLGGNYVSFHGNYSSSNGLNIGNSYSLQSNFVNNGSRFTGVEHFSRDSYLPYEQRLGLASLNPGNQPVYSGMTGSGFPNYTWMGAVGYQPGLPVYSTQQSTVFSDNASTSTPRQDMRQTTQNASFTLGNQSNNTSNNAQTTSASAGNTGFVDVGNSGLPAPACSVSACISSSSVVVSPTTSVPAVACAGSSTLTVHNNDNDNNEIDVQGAAGGNAESSLAPYCSDANNDNSGGTILNRDFGTDSVESTDNSLLALEQRVSEACALVERVLREREEREQFGREIERKEQLIREQRERERREREERELQEAERWPQQQEAITARSQWLCEHYQRHCRVRFPCCTQFYPCHRCHNNSRACDNEEAKACHATHLKCSHCQHEQEIDENSGKCTKCEGKMSAYFCSICKHFTSVDKNPYHCEKCGICRIHKDKSFHCEVCNVCLDKRLEGNHKCRPDSGHDECCICLEDAFSGCQILPCSHKVHRECAIAMIQNGIRTCPICRHPLYSPPRG